MSKVTIKDIAKKLDMHHSTVSRALKGRPEISEKTRNSVTRTALEMGYTPNQAALALRGETATTVALITPNISHYGVRLFVQELSKTLFKKGITLQVHISKGGGDESIKHVCSGSSMASIAVSFTSSFKRRVLALSERTKQPLLVVDLDYEGLIVKTVQNLVSRGKRKPFMISDCTGTTSLQTAFKEALLEHYIPYLGDSFKSDISSVEEGARVAETVGRGFDKPDVLIFASAEAAVGFCMKAQQGALGFMPAVVCLEASPLLSPFDNVDCMSSAVSLNSADMLPLLRDLAENSSHMVISGY